MVYETLGRLLMDLIINRGLLGLRFTILCHHIAPPDGYLAKIYGEQSVAKF